MECRTGQETVSGMNMRERSLSLLRLLTSAYVEADAAELLLSDEPMEILLDIQAVMVMGMAAAECGREDIFLEPRHMYEKHQKILPVIGNINEEVQWMLQPGYKSYLESGMRMLALRE